MVNNVGSRITPRDEKNLKKIEVVNDKKKWRNYVVEDRIIREIVEKEISSQIRFEQRWSCLRSENIYKLHQEILRMNPVDHELLRKHTKYHRCQKVSQKSKFSSLRIPAVPISSSNFIGWRSTNPECILEIFGPIHSSEMVRKDAKNSVLKEIQYFHILLG